MALCSEPFSVKKEHCATFSLELLNCSFHIFPMSTPPPPPSPYTHSLTSLLFLLPSSYPPTLTATSTMGIITRSCDE